MKLSACGGVCNAIKSNEAFDVQYDEYIMIYIKIRMHLFRKMFISPCENIRVLVLHSSLILCEIKKNIFKPN